MRNGASGNVLFRRSARNCAGESYKFENSEEPTKLDPYGVVVLGLCYKRSLRNSSSSVRCGEPLPFKDAFDECAYFKRLMSWDRDMMFAIHLR
jgi:hypothetical protein